MDIRNDYSSVANSYEKKGTVKNSSGFVSSAKRIDYSVDNYKISILLDDANRFLGVESVRVFKNFYNPVKLPYTAGRSTEEIVDEFFKNIEE